MPQHPVRNLGSQIYRVLEQRGQPDRDRIANRLARGIEAGQIGLIVGTVDASDLAGMAFFDYRTHQLGSFAQMGDRLAINGTMNLFIESSDAGAQSQHHSAATDSIQVERIERRFDRAAGERERHPRTDLELGTRHRNCRERWKWWKMQLRRPYAIQTDVLEATRERGHLGGGHRLNNFPVIVFHKVSMETAARYSEPPLKRPNP